jgi:hypothetical protein
MPIPLTPCAKPLNGSSMRLSGGAIRTTPYPSSANEAVAMSKGLNQKKDTKKKPAKTLKEKRAEKDAKRQSKG